MIEEILKAIISAGGAIFAAAIAAYVGATIAAKKQVDKGVKKISVSLPSWDELFEHDENGNPIKGSIHRLIEAVHKGYPIKVKINRPRTDDIELMDAEWIFVENGVVVATNTSQISLGKDRNTGKYRYAKEAYHYYVILSSKGHHHATRIYIDGTPKENLPPDGTRHMTWIGLVPPSL